MPIAPGYIGAVEETNPVLRFLLRTLFEPVTYEIHHFIIGDYVSYLDDFQVLESITSKGCSVRMLKSIKGKPIHFYRHKDWTPGGGNLMVVAWWLRATKRYDYIGIVKFIWHTLRAFPYRARPSGYPYRVDGSVWCTEIVDECAREAGTPLVPLGVWPNPWSFRRSQELGVMCKQ